MSGIALRFGVHQKTRRARASWVWLLSLSLLGQVLLPVQAHTRWQRDAGGQLIELCTLQGTRAVRVDPHSGAPLPATTDVGHSPAMAFSAVLDHATPPGMVSWQAPLGCFAPPPAGRAPPAHLAPDLPDALIRGPPTACR